MCMLHWEPGRVSSLLRSKVPYRPRKQQWLDLPGDHSLTLPTWFYRAYFPRIITPLPAPTKDWWGCPQSRPDPWKDNSHSSQLRVKSHIAKGLADHQPPLPGDDGQGPEACDAYGGEEKDQGFKSNKRLFTLLPLTSQQLSRVSDSYQTKSFEMFSGPEWSGPLGELTFLSPFLWHVCLTFFSHLLQALVLCFPAKLSGIPSFPMSSYSLSHRPSALSLVWIIDAWGWYLRTLIVFSPQAHLHTSAPKRRQKGYGLVLMCSLGPFKSFLSSWLLVISSSDALGRVPGSPNPYCRDHTEVSLLQRNRTCHLYPSCLFSYAQRVCMQASGTHEPGWGKVLFIHLTSKGHSVLPSIMN